MIPHVVGAQHLMDEHQTANDLTDGHSLWSISNPGVLDAGRMKAQEILVLGEITRPSAKARFKCSSSVALSKPASVTLTTSAPRWRNPRETALATCSST